MHSVAYSDCVLCYKNGLVAVEKHGNRGNMSSKDLLLNRMSLVEQQILQSGGMVAHCNKSRYIVPHATFVCALQLH